MGIWKTWAVVAGIVICTSTAEAAELSPWMGSADQTAFQLDPVTMVAVTFATADPLQTGSTGKRICGPHSCVAAPMPAMASDAVSRAPQN
jgi:hypothetical protein